MNIDKLEKRIEECVLDYGTKLKDLDFGEGTDIKLVLLMNPSELETIAKEFDYDCMGKWGMRLESMGNSVYTYREMDIVLSDYVERGKIEVGIFIK